jgi:capsule biosynthesis phosphatase
MRKEYPYVNFEFIELTHSTRGASETILIGLNHLYANHKDQPILCLDADNIYFTDILSLWNKDNQIFTFKDNNSDPIYSYVKKNSTGDAIDIIEKEKISDDACTGAYGFKSYYMLMSYCDKIIKNDIRQKGEFYTSGVIKEMINNNNVFSTLNIDKNKYACLGTPTELRLFTQNFMLYDITENKLIKKRRYCFDLDNTLTTFPKVKGDYSTTEPIQQNINILKYIKKFGNTIIIYTARRMETHNGNVGMVIADIAQITIDTLKKFDIPYDELYFGKPHADFYIDDLGISCYDDLQKELGYYNTCIEPRYFNKLELNTIDIFTKYSNDLSGEIYYYKNIPIKLKHMFPVLFEYCENNKWYKIEKIVGLTVSELYVSKLLTEMNLINVMNAIETLQLSSYEETYDIDIYFNYNDKLTNRYKEFDYSKYNNAHVMYNELSDKLIEYQKYNSGKRVVIHGDPVFTNIIINSNGKIKFIDMKGIVDKNLTITGDWLYDWAKIYQSLIGYDYIINDNNNIDLEYQSKMIDVFKKYFLKKNTPTDFENLKTITKSLLFSLIPLHANDKCTKYYNLLKSNYLNHDS